MASLDMMPDSFIEYLIREENKKLRVTLEEIFAEIHRRFLEDEDGFLDHDEFLNLSPEEYGRAFTDYFVSVADDMNAAIAVVTLNSVSQEVTNR